MKFSRGRSGPAGPETAISQYAIGQRIVGLVRSSDGHTRWICNCDRYRASLRAAQGPWCKHVAKAAAIRSIERLTGERVISCPPRANACVGRAPTTEHTLPVDPALLAEPQQSRA
jgi:hypothetical protein